MGMWSLPPSISLISLRCAAVDLKRVHKGEAADLDRPPAQAHLHVQRRRRNELMATRGRNGTVRVQQKSSMFTLLMATSSMNHVVADAGDRGGNSKVHTVHHSLEVEEVLAKHSQVMLRVWFCFESDECGKGIVYVGRDTES